jgi:hypothetical protein
MNDIEKPKRVTREGFRHRTAGTKPETFFQHIDDIGGWPLYYEYVGFAHTPEREAAFTTECTNTGWWTTLYHRDDYLMWKLSPEAWESIYDAAKQMLINQLSSNAKAPPYGLNIKTYYQGCYAKLHPDFDKRKQDTILNSTKKLGW